MQSLSHIKASEVIEYSVCGNILLWGFKGSVYRLPYEIKPTKGKHDFNTCEDCKGNLKRMINNYGIKFNGKGKKKPFPYCCEQHIKLTDEKLFNRNDFVNVPKISAYKYIYTYQHIINNIDNENWYTLISDYIDYAVDSFGEFPTGCGESLYISEYLQEVKRVLEGIIPQDRKEKLLVFLNKYIEPNTNTELDLKIIFETYEKWVNLFPFQLNYYFTHLEDKLKNTIPLFSAKSTKNLYSGKEILSFHTKETLIEFLKELTNIILSELSGKELYTNGVIGDLDKHKLDLLLERRNQKTLIGYKLNNKTDEALFRQMITQWLDDETEFFLGLTQVFNNNPITAKDTLLKEFKERIDKYGFSELPKVKALAQPILLYELIIKQNLPFKVALLDYVGFIKHMQTNYYQTKYKLYPVLAYILNSSKGGDGVKGQLASLTKNQPVNNGRYNAYKYKETAIIEYQKLK
jgi:hypothetical protein